MQLYSHKTSKEFSPQALTQKVAHIATATQIQNFHRFENYLTATTLNSLFLWNPISENVKSFGFSPGLISFSGKSVCTDRVLELGKIFYLVAIVINCNFVNFHMHLIRPMEEDKELA